MKKSRFTPEHMAFGLASAATLLKLRDSLNKSAAMRRSMVAAAGAGRSEN